MRTAARSSTGPAPPGARLPRPGSIAAWVLAARPATLPAAVVPVAIGAAVARREGTLLPGPVLGALAGALLLQILSNLANDVFDFERGADTSARLGPPRAVQSGLLTPRAVRVGMAAVMGTLVGVGLYLAAVSSPWIVVAGVASILSALAYTGGPFPIGYHGLGELFVFLFFGLVAVTGTTFVVLGTVPPLALFASVPPGTLAAAILVVNNVRDRDTDVLAGKRTLAVRWGRSAARLEYAGLVAIAYATPVALWLLGLVGPLVLAPLSTLPLAGWRVLRLFVDEGRALNRSLVGTAALTLGFGLIFAAALAFDGRDAG
ncbi:MAG TPA: 1,4-dihydroxy-2-naphthoate polyprenyltransferase [Polyangiaceae bacterium]|nr:1,4-dihydroxy-2-naphthoate polyprenyltransferase [Polyangiaceae bacterium]